MEEEQEERKQRKEKNSSRDLEKKNMC